MSDQLKRMIHWHGYRLDQGCQVEVIYSGRIVDLSGYEVQLPELGACEREPTNLIAKDGAVRRVCRVHKPEALEAGWWELA